MTDSLTPYGGQLARQIDPTWNPSLIAGSIAVSLLGAFTSTQLMCQARVSRGLFPVLVWTMLASLTFGFCSVWCLHFVAMLACELDIPLGLSAPWTLLSALLAVIFTFFALATESVLDRYRKHQHRRGRTKGTHFEPNPPRARSGTPRGRQSSEFLLDRSTTYGEDGQQFNPDIHGHTKPIHGEHLLVDSGAHNPRALLSPYTDAPERLYEHSPHRGFQSFSFRRFDEPSPAPGRSSMDSSKDDTESYRPSTDTDSRRDSGFSDSETTSFGLGRFSSIRPSQITTKPSRNIFKITVQVLWQGWTRKNICKGFMWSLALTLMHYIGIVSMRIPQGYFVLEPFLVGLSAIISWIVCTVGCILMDSMETNIGQQLLFAVVASTGVAAMHYTGMAATTFYTTLAPSDVRGYPYSLPVAIASIAIVTCLAANGLLAHSATVARNKLAEIVRTRRKLWAAIAQKENAEAAALARSEFIASASHEIRTPLHQLQGYSDLLDRCSLPDDARLLLFAIQDATKTLSLITNNVLDWSRLEKGEAISRPTNLDVRSVCDSIITLLPRRDDDIEVELIVAVTPEVPTSLYLDETYLHRIIMNLVSNALKFTTFGYVMLLLEMKVDNLVITVTDSGVGIPDSFLPHLYEPFKQAQTRGAERGTGLGLSIVKQLLQKIHGHIETVSRYRDAEGIGAERCGSKFVVNIPIQMPEASPLLVQHPVSSNRTQLAVLSPSQPRLSEGLRTAWDKFDVDIVPIKQFSDLPEDCKQLWVDIKLLQADRSFRQVLVDREDLIVIVPYDREDLFYNAVGSIPPAHFIPVKRPHQIQNIVQTIENVENEPVRLDPNNRIVRFASSIEVAPMLSSSELGSETTSQPPSEPSSGPPSQPESPEFVNTGFDGGQKPVTVLLVEDNKINQKLGSKMLKTLGYEVILASDGQEGVDLLIANDSIVDIILMDQSMPRKDGLTATSEIRSMETDGTLLGATRWRNHTLRKNRRPIIAVTAVVGPGHEALCRSAGTDAFLPKPLSLKRMRETMEEYARDEEQ